MTGKKLQRLLACLLAVLLLSQVGAFSPAVFAVDSSGYTLHDGTAVIPAGTSAGDVNRILAAAMVEDVVTTGGSLLKACERVKDAGLNVVAVCTVLDRGEGGREAIEAAGYQLRALFTRPELVELAKED